MPEQEPKALQKRLHPLPGFCWMWMLGAIHLGCVGALFCYGALFPDPDDEHLIIIIFGAVGLVFLLLAALYGIFWHRFAVRRRLTRRLWHVGIGLLLIGAIALFFVPFLSGSIIYLLTLPVWAQGHTRQFFDRV